MPAVSVLMYVKNGMPYFKRAIDSVINQTLKDIEILVIDGGSTDGTAELVQECESKDKRVRFLKCDVGSVGVQFNLGLREAKGEYIGIVESDDYIFPEMYEKEYLCAKDKNCDILRADNYIYFDLNGEEIMLRLFLPHNMGNYERVFSAEKDADKIFISGSFWSGIYRREFLLNNNIWKNETRGAAYQDAGFSFLTFALAKSVYFMKDAFYCYRKDNMLSSCNSPRNLELVKNEYKFIKENLKQRGLWEKYKKYYYIWKIRSELWFYANLRASDKSKYLENNYEDIYAEIHGSDIWDYQWNQKESEFIRSIEKSLDEARSYLMKEDNSWNKACKVLAGLSNDKKVYIFGAGNLGEIICKYLFEKKIIPEAYLDNNSKLWGMKKNDIKIVSPQEVIVTQNTIFVVCSENYATEIVQQLRETNIEDDMIVICSDIDSCIRFFIRANCEDR